MQRKINKEKQDMNNTINQTAMTDIGKTFYQNVNRIYLSNAHNTI